MEAIEFYQKAGFTITSEAYIDVNIWHVDMQLAIERYIKTNCKIV